MQVLHSENIEVGYDHGFLRYFRIRDTEVLRMIYFAVRDVNWGNIDPVISGEVINTSENFFQISYVAGYYCNDQRIFEWHVNIEGNHGQQKITFEIQGKAFQEFRTNRAGFCILHPVEQIAGQPLTVKHSDHSIQRYKFPELIAPHQSFTDIQNMQWEVNGITCDLEFYGNIFEIEDQRNWGDASYKTYCTPLRLPFPKTIYAGDTIDQKIIFKYTLGKMRETSGLASQPFLNENLRIGTSFSEMAGQLSEICIEKLKVLRLNHVRVEVWPAQNDWQTDLSKHIWNSGTLGTRLELVVYLSASFEEELDALLYLLSDHVIHIQTLTLLSQDEPVTSQAIIDQIPLIKKRIPGVETGIGTRYNFTELNRNRFQPGEADFVSLSFDPQQHACDDLTVMENAMTPKYMAESLRALFQKPVHFSPVLLKRRFNPYATEASAIAVPFEKQMDIRQKTAFLSEWVNALLTTLQQADIASITLFGAIGELGLMDENGNEYPVYQTLKQHATRHQ